MFKAILLKAGLNTKTLSAGFCCCLLMVALGACGSKGGGKKSPDPAPSPTPTTKSYKLGGSVSGLSGNLAISNGTDSLTLNADGQFTFLKPVSEGSLYDIKIVALPQNQLCELRNSKNYMYRDHGDVGIECATLVDKKINFDIPKNYTVNDLRLRSNYQSKGGSGEDPLTDTSPMLTVYDNSLVTLRDKDDNLLYVAFTGTLDSGDIVLNSRSTAIALVVLYPSIIEAIQDLELDYTSAMNGLIAGMETSGELINLATQIQSSLDKPAFKNKDNKTVFWTLNNPESDLQIPLSKALDKATSILANLRVKSASGQSSSAGNAVKAQKLSTGSLASVTGVDFKFSKLTDSQGIQFAAQNLTGRSIGLYADEITSLDGKAVSSVTVKIFPAVGEFILPTPIASQSNFTVLIAGPGLVGDVSDANLEKVRDATKSTVHEQLLFPSINILLGLKKPVEFSFGDCFSGSNTLSDLDKAENLIPTLNDRIKKKLYNSVFDDLVQNGRAQLISYRNANSQSPIEELFSCEKFGIGKLISSKKSIAVANLTNWITSAYAIYSAQGVSTNLTLYTKTNLNNLAVAISKNAAETQWVLSNKLQLNINAKSLRVALAASTDFSGSCVNPVDSTPLACTIDWDFGDGAKKTGASVSNAFAKEGSYTVTATAKDADGAQQTQTLKMEVLPIKPIIKLSLPNGNDVGSNAAAYNFGNINIGLTDTLKVTVTNDGFSDLTVTNIQSSGAAFQISPAQLPSLAPGASAQVDVIFSPTAEQTFNSDISFISNANNQSNYIFKTTGRGIGSAGYWKITQNGVTQTITAAKVTNILDVDNHNLQIRIFASTTNEYPQVRLLLKNYDLNTNTRGDGTYSFDDLNGNETCFGFYASSTASLDEQFCTSTLNRVAPNLMTGSAQISGGAASNKTTAFDFDALSRACVGDVSLCQKIHLTGEAFFNTGL